MIDLWLAAGGYLRSADGRVRFIDELADIAYSMIQAGLTARWGKTRGHGAICYHWRDDIVLAPWLFDCPAEQIRYALRHEAGHCMVGASESKVERWYSAMYGEGLA